MLTWIYILIYNKIQVKPIGHPTKNRSGRVRYNTGHPSKKFILYSVWPIKARSRPSNKINNYIFTIILLFGGQ